MEQLYFEMLLAQQGERRLAPRNTAELLRRQPTS
jgi:hypothetical protein